MAPPKAPNNLLSVLGCHHGGTDNIRGLASALAAASKNAYLCSNVSTHYAMLRISILIILFNSTQLFSQELYEAFLPSMKFTDSTTVHSTENSLVRIQYYDSTGFATCSAIFYPNGKIHRYYSYFDMEGYDIYDLNDIEWDNNELVRYQYLGPGDYQKTWMKDTLGNTTIIDIDSLGQGISITYDSNQNIIRKGVIDFAYEKVTEYYTNGQVWKQHNECFNGRRFENYKEFDKNGLLIVEGEYTGRNEKGILDCANEEESVKHGTWRYYESGKLIRKEVWKLGNLIK